MFNRSKSRAHYFFDGLLKEECFEKDNSRITEKIKIEQDEFINEILWNAQKIVSNASAAASIDDTSIFTYLDEMSDEEIDEYLMEITNRK